MLALLLGRRAGDARAGAIGALAFGVVTSYREVLWWACLGGLALGLTIVLVGFLAFEKGRERGGLALVLAGACSFAAPLAIGSGLALGPALALEAWFLGPRERRARLGLAVMGPWLVYVSLYAAIALGSTRERLEHETPRGPGAVVTFAVDSVGLGVVGRTLALEAPAGREELVGFGLAVAYVLGLAVLAWRLEAPARRRLALAQAYLALVIAPVALARSNLGAAAPAWPRYQYFPALAWTTAVALGLAPLWKRWPRASLTSALLVLAGLAAANARAARDETRPFAPRQRALHPDFVRRLVAAARKADGPLWDPELAPLSRELSTFVLPPTRASTIVELFAPDAAVVWTSAVTVESLAPYEADPLLAAVVASRARR